MKRTRHALAIALLAAALCADRAVAASPQLRPQVSLMAGKLVSRLSVTFRRVVPAVKVYQTPHDVAVQTTDSWPVISDKTCIRERLSPLLLHLPPPSFA